MLIAIMVQLSHVELIVLIVGKLRIVGDDIYCLVLNVLTLLYSLFREADPDTLEVRG